MKKRYSIFLAAISLAAIMMLAQRSRSCGPELAPNEGRFSLFRPEVTGDGGLTDFNYTHDYLNGLAETDTDYRRNCKEWQAFTHNAASMHDIYEIQYNVSPDEFIYAYNTGNWNNLEDNSFIQWLRQKKNTQALEYMAIAKKIEFNQQSYLNDPWGDKTPGHSETVGAYELKEQMDKPMPEFLQERYAFQYCKLLYYFDSPGEFKHRPDVLAFYDKNLRGRQSIVADWALIYYALSQPNRQLRNLYMMYTFDRSDSKKRYTYQWLSAKDMDTLEQAATTATGKVLPRAIKAMMTSSRALPDIRFIYGTDPHNRYLSLLITREINKLEDWIWSPEILKFQPALQLSEYMSGGDHTSTSGMVKADTTYAYYQKKNLQKDHDYLQEVRGYLEFMLEHGGVDKDFLNISIAHLYNMEKNYSAAGTYLKHIRQQKNPYFAKQLAIERLIVLTGLEDITTNPTKQQVYANIKEIEGLGLRLKKDTDDDYWNFGEQDDDLGELLLLLSRLYQAKGDVVTAGLLQQKSHITTNEYTGYCEGDVCYPRIAYFDRYGQPSDIDKVLELKHKKDKTAFEDYITTELAAQDDFYLDLKGTMLVRDKKYKEALAVMDKINDSFWVNAYEYKNYLPKTSIANVGTVLPVPSGPATKYVIKSKKLIVRDLVALQDGLQSAKTRQEKANASFLMANAMFNISYDGKGWMVYSYGRSTHMGGWWWPDEDWVYYNFASDDKRKLDAYYNYTDAVALYREALAYAGKDNELAAKCALMLAFCDRQVHYNQLDFFRNNIHYTKEGPQYTSPYLRMLVKKYEATNTYYKSVGYCPDVL